MIFLGERFRRMQWLAVILVGVRRAGATLDLFGLAVTIALGWRLVLHLRPA